MAGTNPAIFPEHVPKAWRPVFRKGHATTKKLEHF
jgi:hypothetical protein